MQLARNKGVQSATSNYVTLCDSDDLLAPDYVETINAWLLENPLCDTVYCNFRNFTESSIDVDKFSKAPAGFFAGADKDGDFLKNVPHLYGKSINFQPLFSSGVTIKKSFYQSIGGYNQLFNGVGAEDWEYTLRTVERGTVALCMRPIVFIRRHSSNDSRNPLRQLIGEIKILEYAKKNHPIASEYTEEIYRSLNQRRVDAFELAFGMRDYDAASEILAHIENGPGRMKYHVKVILTNTRSLIRAYTTNRVNKLTIGTNKQTGKT